MSQLRAARTVKPGEFVFGSEEDGGGRVLASAAAGPASWRIVYQSRITGHPVTWHGDPEQEVEVDLYLDPDQRYAWNGARVLGYEDLHQASAATGPETVARIELEQGGQAELGAEEAVRVALTLLAAAAQGRAEQNPAQMPQGPTADDELRWRLHVAAASVEDMTFWVKHDPQRGYQATEIESGVSGDWAESARAALENYWEGHYYRGEPKEHE